LGTVPFLTHLMAASGKPRRGIAPNMVTQDAAKVQEAFCKATGARNFFTLQDEDTKRLMHGAVVTAYGAGGHIFFEDISLNPFKDTLKVPFVDYRCNNQSHIILHANVPNAPELATKMLKSNACGVCTEVIPVQKQFWGAEFGILRDGCGVLWALSTKAEGDMEASPYPPPVRCCVSVPDADGYLKFLKEAFGDMLVEESTSKDDAGLKKVDLLILGSGFSMIREAEYFERCCVELATAPASGKEVAEALGGPISKVDEKTWMVRMECGICINIIEPPMTA